ncbi:MAG: translation initiation factor [Sulfurimonas sp.]
MSRGKKLDIFIGSEIESGWTVVETARKTTVSDEILEPNKHFLFFKKEKRRGKTVTLVGEFYMPSTDVNALLQTIKKRLGCGGAYKDGWMEFQGDIKDKIRAILVEEGFRFRPQH